MFGFLRRRKRSGKQDDGSVNVTTCIVSAMAIVALADGKLSHAEKDVIVQIVGAYKKGLMSPQEILQLVEQTLLMFQTSGEEHWREVFVRGRGLPAESKRTVLDAAGHIALTDNDLHHRERELIGKIATWIGMEEGEFEIWNRDFQQRVEMG